MDNAPLPGAFATAIPDYLQHLSLRGYADNTLKAYAGDLRNLQVYLARYDITLLQLASERMVNRWLDEGLQHLGWSRRTAVRKLEAARAFFAWARGQGWLKHDPCAAIKIRFRPKQVIAPELEPLKRVVATIGTTETLDIRDRALLMLMLDAALRVSEVCGLDMPVGSGRQPTYTVSVERLRVYVRPKGGDMGEAEFVGIEEQTGAALRAWMKVRHRLSGDSLGALFVDASGKRLSRGQVYWIVRQRGAAVGLPNLHPHLLRHRRVGDVVERLGLDIGSGLARHKHKATTVNVYGAHAAEVQRAAIRNAAPLGEFTCNA